MGFANIKANSQRADAISEGDSELAGAGEFPDDFRKISFFRWFTSQFALTAMFHNFANVLADGWGYKTQIGWRARGRVEPYILRDQQSLVTTVSVSQALDSLQDPVLRLGLRIKGLLSIAPDWGAALSATSKAQAYYDRYEPGHGVMPEQANLFHPSWMARNVLAR